MDGFLGFGTAMVVITAIFVALRLIANMQTKRLLIDDGNTLNSYVIFLSLTITIVVPVVATLLLAGTYAIAYLSMKGTSTLTSNYPPLTSPKHYSTPSPT